LSPQRRVFTSYGTGFRAPNFVDLYWPDPFFSTGNPNLQPEESKSIELGTTGSSGATQWSTSVFRTRIENLIVLTGTNFLPTNLNRATINGVELGGSTRIEAWQLGANLTLLDPRDDATDKYLQRRSRYAARLDVDRRVGRTQWGATLLGQGARYDDPANNTRLGAYALLNLRVEQTMGRDWRLGMRLENAMDRQYQTVAGFNSVGRSLFATLFYQPAAK
jgi:vitamin B12 transporter